ncbi:peroxisomal leader peptide-processing protease-like [Heterodontus francisci]|uniref:peroxisomal leader peptide-processing protease-like n=1 Tax=Heterodontus francisci TaxID=7792 RepID=UPI00355B88F6
MISPESCSCIVSAELRSCSGGGQVAREETQSGIPALSLAPDTQWDEAWSCSGLLLDGKRGLVLCHGQIFFPFLQQREQDLRRKPFLLPGAFHKDLQIHVQFPAANLRTKPNPPLPLAPNHAGALDAEAEPLNSDSNPKLPSVAPGLVKLQSYSQAEMLLVFPCPEFQAIFQTLFNKSDKWHFYSEDKEQELRSELLDLVWFGLLRCPGWADDALGGENLQYARSECLRKGQPLFSCASPFASFCSEIFMNTLSKGIVSNLAGERNAMILTDARCLPGTEGGGIYVKSQDLYYLVGLIVAPLCWKANEWVGLTLVCSVTCIFETVRRILDGFDKSCKKVSFCSVSGHLPLTNPGRHSLTRLLTAVALLECDRVWGSGVIVSPRLILTCRHVLDQASAVRVKIQSDSNSCLVLKGRVLFATKENSAYDVAVVELEDDLPAVEPPAIASGFSTGEDVCVIGYGVFGHTCGPSVTAGILSAVITVDNQPVMLQTTCGVHAGASGGPVIRTSNGELLGIVSSNARNNSAGATYPHLNFSLPITVLQPLLSAYNQTRDVGVFEGLNKASDRLRALWRLQGSFSSSPKSKL